MQSELRFSAETMLYIKKSKLQRVLPSHLKKLVVAYVLKKLVVAHVVKKLRINVKVVTCPSPETLN
jgi:hypothetical protein